ncbi:hypothetical protein D3C83_270410 [compost metagenome]
MPRSMRSEFASAGSFGSTGRKEKRFQKIRLACHGETNFSCSGNFDGSAAATKASSASMAEAV